MKARAALLLLTLVALPLLTGCTESSGKDFSFVALDGDTVHLRDYRGKVVILDLMATWCTPCEYQMQELKKIYDAYHDQEVVILSVDIDTRETAQQLRQYKQNFASKYGYPLEWTFGLNDGSIWEEYKYTAPGSDGPGIPMIYIFDQSGQVHFRHTGLAVHDDVPPGWPSKVQKLAPVIDELLE
ncbi:MAG TPA: TlpA family protein disulfide reductase [Thermoplasmatales archaeon]|mgnify:CR=1 FL=1|nr:TlpA family protein disulfide reductase [Thermoplasmatales archaeon]